MNSFIILDGIYFTVFLVLEIIVIVSAFIGLAGWLSTLHENKMLKTQNRCLEQENSALSEYYYKRNFNKDMKNNEVDYVTGAD